MPYDSKEKQADHYRRNKRKYFDRLWTRKYGITVDDYERILNEQNHQCKLCAKHVLELGRVLYIDHCHETGRVRGLLCNACNAGLGMLGDNEAGLLRALNYIRSN